MARRKKKSQDTPVSPKILSGHIKSLGFVTPWLYEEWCRHNRLSTAEEKLQTVLDAEADLRRSQQAQVTRESKLHRNPRRLIEDACDGKIFADSISRPEWQAFCHSIAASNKEKPQRESLKKLLLFVHDKADFLLETVEIDGQTYRYIDALVKLNDRRGLWLRQLPDWRKPSHNAHRQFSSLARHLLANYPVPEFMDQAWLRTGAGTSRFRDWFIHLGKGFNFREARTPFTMTKKMAHYFLEAPATYSIEAALRYGQITALGGDRRLVEALLPTPVGTSFESHEFWTSVFRFFIANPMLDLAHAGPIIDFLNQQKFQSREIVTAPGEVEVEPPPQPGLSMKGRTAAALLEQMHEWHGALRKTKHLGEQYFRASGIAGYRRHTGRDDNVRTWIIRELLSSDDLVAEGRAMRHCVASYAQSCAKGACSIWAMERHGKGVIDKVQTIEVMSSGQVVQCRGPRNTLPSSSQFSVIKDWAKGAGLTISPYIMTSD